MAIELDDHQNLKVPPHSIEAERSVLGGLMLDSQAWDRISTLISENDFYRSEHRPIFRAMQWLVGQNKPLDIVTLAETLELHGELELVGGLAYLTDLATGTPSASNVAAYAEIVQERATVRKLISVAHDIAESGFNPQGRDSARLIDEAESKVFKIGDERPSHGGPESVRPLLAKAIEKIDELYLTKGALTGISSGFQDIDNITSGLQPSDLVIVAGRPSMEMPSNSLIMRMLSSLGRIDQSKIRSGQLGDDDWPRLTSAVTLLNDKQLFVDDTPGLTPNEMRSRSRRIVREHGQIGMIVVDYLQLMQTSGTPENRATEISEISRSLKSIAKEFDCPVIAGSQLNRSLEQRTDKRPIMSDLRESGAIEQDADLIMAVYRDEVYHEDTPDRGVAEIIILKQRNGPIGRKKLAFIGQYTKFEDLARDYDDYYE